RRPQPLLRGYRQAGRRADPRQDRDQRTVAAVSEAVQGAGNWAIDPVDLAAELIRRPSVTPKDEGALDIVARRLEHLGFVCHRLVFDDPGSEPIANLYARFGAGRPNLCF